MVLKTGSDRPVQPGTSTLFGPVLQKNQKFRKNRQKPETGGLIVKIANRSGWIDFGPVPLIPKLHRFGLLFLDPNPNFSLSFFHLFASRSPLASLSLTPLSPSRSRSLHLSFSVSVSISPSMSCHELVKIHFQGTVRWVWQLLRQEDEHRNGMRLRLGISASTSH